MFHSLTILVCFVTIFELCAAEDKQRPFIFEDKVKPGNDIITRDFGRHVEKILDEEQVHGVAIGIVRPDGEIELGAWGTSSEGGQPATADTLFAIGSCTKAFLTASFGILIDDFKNSKNVIDLPPPLNNLDWHTKIKHLIPEDWVLKDKWIEEKADLRDIFSHVSGLVGHDFSYKAQDSEKDIVRRLRHHNTPLELRQKWAYNNEMFVTAAYILEKYSGMSFPNFAHQRIFSPLGMNATSMSDELAVASSRLSQSWSLKQRRIPFWFSGKNMKTIAGAGGIISSARDMSKWVNVLLHNGVDPVTGLTIIPRSSFEDITTASAVIAGQGIADIQSITGYGLGWMLASVFGYNTIAHSGGLPGFLSLVQFFPNSKLGFVSLTNTDNGDRVNGRLSLSIMEVALGIRHNNPTRVDPIGHPYMREDVTTTTFGTMSPSEPPSLALSAYSGTYYAPDYGNLSFCTYPLVPDRDSTYCERLRSSFTLVDTAENRTLDSPQLIATSDSFWCSNLRFTHLRNDTFAIQALTIFENGYGTDNSPFTYTFSEGQIARFRYTGEAGRNSTINEHRDAQVTGFYACGLMRDADSQKECEELDSPPEGSLVWFEKINNF